MIGEVHGKNGTAPTSQNQYGGDERLEYLITRTSYCHEYIGSGVSGYEELVKPIKEMRDDKKLTLFN